MPAFLFSQYRRNLPHWRFPGSTYFITWRLHKSQGDLTPDERDRVVSALRHFAGTRYDLLAYVVMTDHVHVLARPLGDHRLEQLTHSWKSFTANRMQKEFGRVGALWQDESLDRIVRDEDEFWEKARYILENPARRWPETQNYAWVWLQRPGEAADTTAHTVEAKHEDSRGLSSPARTGSLSPLARNDSDDL